MKVTVSYFASLREQAGCAQEEVETRAKTVEELYEEIKSRHNLSVPSNQLKFARNNEFCSAAQPVQTNDHVLFMPPVSGG